MDQHDELRPVAELKRDTQFKDRFWYWNHAPFIYTVLVGFLGLLCTGLWWVAKLDGRVTDNGNYIDTQRREGLMEEVHRNTENGKRRDTQIQALNRKVFGLPDP